MASHKRDEPMRPIRCVERRSSAPNESRTYQYRNEPIPSVKGKKGKGRGDLKYREIIADNLSKRGWS